MCRMSIYEDPELHDENVMLYLGDTSYVDPSDRDDDEEEPDDDAA